MDRAGTEQLRDSLPAFTYTKIDFQPVPDGEISLSHDITLTYLLPNETG